VVSGEKDHPEISFDYVTLERFKSDEYAGSPINYSMRAYDHFHAPSWICDRELSIRSFRRVSRDRLREVFNLVPYFHPMTVVCHPSFDNRYYVSTEELWLTTVLKHGIISFFMAEAGEYDHRPGECLRKGAPPTPASAFLLVLHLGCVLF